MFDPTAFDNIKFMMQAEVYDRDLAGLFHIHHRTDIMDLASLSREAAITFSLAEKPGLQVSLIIKADLAKLAGELLPLAGTVPSVSLRILYAGSEQELPAAKMDLFERIWGTERRYERKKIESDQTGTVYEWHVYFERMITEEMLPELGDLVNFIAESLQMEAKDNR
ncbi:hypothetical protein [Pseudobacillus badius]|uniref:hypothetical protein n=1 Tax=Bacillus badius TaxID=1455 RepID=UPI0007B07621|nr:hypothetical protein [Bacillus badius]KZN99027.1 hypothetical protein A4244_08000 [Bacillus badius]MED0664967.1 hypothetical protein [Bacillus badius]OCS83966.1 hypothetical protein A6M11_08015 [Bacillus badius]OVE52740.1 hypothetical protein B1A98_03845 [Bacillus badius]TDW04758.1 hypothetical protein B0G66_102187 [Bacillus badius]